MKDKLEFECSHVDEGDQGVNDAKGLQTKPVMVTASGDGRKLCLLTLNYWDLMPKYWQ